MAGKRKLDSRSFAEQKRRKRQFVTFIRMCRYGINNFTRNAWLTVAATAVMTITLFIVFSTLAARSILMNTLDAVESKVNMSIYVSTDTPNDDVAAITKDLRQLSSVKNVSYITPDEGRQSYAEQNASDPNTIQAIAQSTNEFPGTFSIKVEDINNTSQLEDFVKTNPTIKKDLDPKHAPSFAGQSKASIKTIGKVVDFAQKVGIIASVIFASVSILIIFNTIRMAIFNRREEIQMMKLIGADRSFVRGPFLVEAIVYGFIAAIVASGLGYTILYLIQPALAHYGIDVQLTINDFTYYAGFIVLGMILLGALIGVFSSLLATRRYLKF